ncbi:hypothetical protein NMQ14_14635 [Methyloversatilis sp. XJ19-13]|uniref:hypothetical protein n=1 Tax=Methyloversatilis sp. XJ19-13 TaxID=2963430 RepID=UPI00211CE60E|nr:hypothetical protein [Methyloversatilis sp. XJ19-13]MCQ9375487.1 hypothetical protein [Methyloversatilis sp. XJ19-13]
MMNWKSFVAAVLILALGIGVSGVLAMRYYTDIAFYFTSTKQSVQVERVRVQEERIADPVHAAHYHDVESELLIRTPRGDQHAFEHFSGSAPAAAAHIAALRALEGRTVDGYLSPHAPHHFALTLEFPWTRLGALALVLLVLVLPPGIAICVYVRSLFPRRGAPARS